MNRYKEECVFQRRWAGVGAESSCVFYLTLFFHGAFFREDEAAILLRKLNLH